MDSEDIAEARAMYNLEPWDGLRGDVQAGIVASTIANVHRGTNQPAVSLRDFLIDWFKLPPQPQDPAAMAEVLKAVTLALGGSVN
jgi:hypothetical protein